MAYHRIADVIDDYGPAVAADPELDIVITLNGAYFNVWIESGGQWANTEAYDAVSRLRDDPDNVDPFNTLETVTLHEAMDEAEDLLETIKDGGA